MAEQSQLAQMTQQMQLLAEQLQASQGALDNAKTIVDENNRLKQQLLQLTAEYTAKMNTANQVLVGARNKAKEYFDDAQGFAQVIAQSGAVKPPTTRKSVPVQNNGIKGG
jgi:ABC-type Zn uptake system ZnuABC Zn-binding protein ZnuA